VGESSMNKPNSVAIFKTVEKVSLSQKYLRKKI
jgi:hypothetical protein